MSYEPHMPVRIARPSADLDVAETFWVGGVGLEVQWRTEGEVEGGHQLLMVGPAGGVWHLELVQDPDQLRDFPPGPEDLLVLYLGEEPDAAWTERIEASGGRRVASRNPYWDRWGQTYADPDGHLLVLSHRTWP